nr:hypothetical protein [Tanacetum cinerariifolium]
MNDKIKDPECVTHKVKIAPHDYSKENFLATFTPHKQLTPEQIFWSQDLIKMKSKALKEQTTVSRPIKALTVYPPNTPATLVRKVLSTKSQVKNHIFTLIQLFSEFNKTFKKRITPIGLTEGKWVLNKPRNVISRRKHDEIKRKNLLIANDNLIAECLSKQVFSVATNYELNVARFTEMHVTNTIVEARCLELVAELSNLRDKNHNDNHDELVNRFLILSVSKDHVKPKVLTPGKYAIDVEPIVLHLRNNSEAHLSSRTTLMEQMTQLISMCEMFCQIIQKKQEEKKIEEEQAANALYWKILACCDDDDDYNSAITPNELVDSLSPDEIRDHEISPDLKHG